MMGQTGILVAGVHLECLTKTEMDGLGELRLAHRIEACEGLVLSLACPDNQEPRTEYPRLLAPNRQNGNRLNDEDCAPQDLPSLDAVIIRSHQAAECVWCDAIRSQDDPASLECLPC